MPQSSPSNDPQPKSQVSRPSFLYIRAKGTDKERWIQAAQLAKLTLDDWVSKQLNAAAPPLKKSDE